MSWSACYYCMEMVPYYDKYCKQCQKKYGLLSLPEYQKGRTWPSPEERAAEFKKDRRQ